MIKNINDKYIKRIDKRMILESMYLFILALYLIRVFFDTTMFSLPWPARYYDFVRLGIGGYLVIKVVLREYRNNIECLLEILYLIVFSLIYRGTGYMFLLELGFLVLGAKDISYKKILGLYLFIGSSIMVITILGALTGCIKDLIYVDDGMYKHAFGIVYTTDFAAHIFFLVLAYLAYKGKAPDFVFNIFLVFVAFILYLYSGARNSSGSLLFLLFGNLYIGFTDKILSDNSMSGKNKKIKLKIIEYMDYCLVLSVPLLAMFAIVSSIFYSPNNKIMSTINSIASGRLRLGHSAFQKYGISLWGNPFEMVGAGGDTVGRINYNFVDSSYLMIFIRYGLVLLLLSVVGFIWISIKANRVSKRHLLIILGVMAIQCTIEHHILEIAYNPFILFVFSRIDNSEKSKTITGSQNRKILFSDYIPIISIILIIAFNHNVLLAYGKTIVKLFDMDGSKGNIYFIFIILIILLVIAAILISARYLIYYILNKSNKITFCKWGLIFGMGVLSLCTGFQTGKQLIKEKSENYLKAVENGTDVLELLTEEEYDLYIDDVPYLYMINNKQHKNIFSGSPYRNRKNETVVITNILKEMPYLINSGYVCGRISNLEYIYTNSVAIANSLREYGIEMNNYYSEIRNVDLLNLANVNNLSIDSKGKLVIAGCNKSLTHGPWVSIYRGRLKVDFDMTLIDTDVVEGKVATLRISSESGANIIKEVPLNKSDFGDSGKLVATIINDIPDSEGVEFLIFAEGNTKILLNSLNYGKLKKV